MPIAGVVADANVLLSAVMGKAALRVFEVYRVPIHTTTFNRSEVVEYLPKLARKYGVSLALAELQLEFLPLRVYSEEMYTDWLPWAQSVLVDRDPEDAHLLALARTLNLPIWSNDKDLQLPNVRCYTTAVLLKVLEN